MFRSIRVIVGAGFLLLAGGCSQVPERGDGLGVSVDGRQRPTHALVVQAESYAQRGAWSQAALTLERALRIDSGDATLWHQLAQMRMEQERWQLAENLALRSNSKAADNQTLQVENWKLIERARWKKGDQSGADKAYQRWQSLISQSGR